MEANIREVFEFNFFKYPGEEEPKTFLEEFIKDNKTLITNLLTETVNFVQVSKTIDRSVSNKENFGIFYS